MPWKNGLGVTSEIAIHPKNADFLKMDFDWRLSSATITAVNSFSFFPNYDRVLTVLSGLGLLLNGVDLKPGRIHRFPGEETIHCQLIGDAVIDLGIIFNRSKFHGDMKVLEFNNESVYSIKDYRQGISVMASSTSFLLPLQEGIIIDGYEFGISDVCKIEGSNPVDIKARRYPIKVIETTIVPIA